MCLAVARAHLPGAWREDAPDSPWIVDPVASFASRSRSGCGGARTQRGCGRHIPSVSTMLLGSSCIKVLTNVVFIYHSGTCSPLFWETDLQSASPRGLTGSRSRCSGNAGERDVLVPFKAPRAGRANPLPGAVRGDGRRRAGGGTPGASPGSPAPGRVGGGDLGPHARWQGARSGPGALAVSGPACRRPGTCAHGPTCLLLLSDSPWKVHLPSVGPEMTGVTVRGLTPARTYQFRVCAVNQVGKGQYSAETSR